MTDTNRTSEQAANLNRLIDALRREDFPEGFAFNYNKLLIGFDDTVNPVDYRGRPVTCGSIGCAIGLMFVLGMIDDIGVGVAADALGITWDTTLAVFHDGTTYGRPRIGDGPRGWVSIRPGEVADELEKVR